MSVMTGDPTDFARSIGNDVHLIDTKIAGATGTTACYVVLGERPALVETGPSRSAPLVIGALAALGIGPADLATIAVTHIHLDHAGGVGDVARAFPSAEVVVHPRGARHLANPNRLMESAHRVYGDVLDAMFGRLRPTEPERIVAIQDGDTIDLGHGRRIRVQHSPGHAGHHVVLLDESNGDLYTGDAAGMFVPESGTYKPTTPPPDFDLAAVIASLDKMRSTRPTRLLFSHFGPGPSVDEGLTAAEEEIRFWVERTRSARAQGWSRERVIAEVKTATDRRYPGLTKSGLNRKWEELSSTEANVSGILRWLETTEK